MKYRRSGIDIGAPFPIMGLFWRLIIEIADPVAAPVG